MFQRDVSLTVMAAAGTAGRAGGRRILDQRDVSAVLARHAMLTVVQQLRDGRVRTCRSRYAYTPGTLYLPPWVHPKWVRRIPPVAIECHLSELDGLREWIYVQVRGEVVPLQPAGDTAEFDAWRKGAAHLSRVLANLAENDQVTSTGYGVLRVDILTQQGVALLLT